MIPSLKQTAGSVASWKPAQIALSTAVLSNLPDKIKQIENAR